MKGRKGFTLIELLVVIAIIAILAAILFPVFARVRKTAWNSDCQSNLSQIGRAFKMYLGEWHDSYPYQDVTQTLSNGYPEPGIALSPTDPTVPANLNPDGTLKRFVYGTNWVEALFPYMEAISKDSAGAWACKAAAEITDSSGNFAQRGMARVNYSMNINLVGQPEGIIKTASNMLLCREMDRKCNAVLRPVNPSTDGSSGSIPIAPFLSATDQGYPSSAVVPNPKQHANGSNVLFSDGHVKSFNAGAMPDVLTAALCYDSTDLQWFNFNDDPANPIGLRKSIAISP